MKTLIQILSVAVPGLLLASTLNACKPAESGAGGLSQAGTPVAAAVPAPACSNCGTIIVIEQLKTKGSSSGFGAVAGAVAGAVVGHQIGDGRGQDAATVAGAIGGGFAGNEIEKRAKGTLYYHVTVQMESGETRTVDVEALNGLVIGSDVRVTGNNLQIVSH